MYLLLAVATEKQKNEKKKLTKQQKELREKLFQKAIDRQIWRGKGDNMNKSFLLLF